MPLVAALVELSKLRPAPWNPKTISKERLLNLARSIAADPVFMWKRPALALLNGHVYAGNQRLAAVSYLWLHGTPPHPDRPGEQPPDWSIVAQQAGIKPGTIPAIIEDEDIPMWLAQERGTKDNGQWGDYEEEALAVLIGGLRTQGRDIGVLGFDDAALKALLAVLVPDEGSGGLGYDPGPGDEPEHPQTREGDLWLMGKHRLVVGDCTDVEVVRWLMGDYRATVVMFDPPYGIDYTEVAAGRYRHRHGKPWEAVAGDMSSDQAELSRMLRQAFVVARAEAAIDDAAWYCWHPPLDNRWIFKAAWEAAGIGVHKEIVWAKPHLSGMSRVEYHWQHEPCMYGWVAGKRPKFLGPKSETTLWQVDFETGGVNRDVKVPTQKPPALWARAINNHTIPGQVIYDGFAGSGPAVIAAEQTDRIALVCEKKPGPADVLLDRWAKMTGKDPIRHDGVMWSSLHPKKADVEELVSVGHNTNEDARQLHLG